MIATLILQMITRLIRHSLYIQMEANEYFSRFYVLLEQMEQKRRRESHMEESDHTSLQAQAFFPSIYLKNRSARTMFYKRTREHFQLADDGFGGLRLEKKSFQDVKRYDVGDHNACMENIVFLEFTYFQVIESTTKRIVWKRVIPAWQLEDVLKTAHEKSTSNH